MRVLITGSSGLIGTALRERLTTAGHEAVGLRRGPRGPDVDWDPASGWIAEGALAGYDAIVHLAGASIGDGRWTNRRKQLLRASRIEATRLLVEHLARAEPRPSVLVCASAIGYYGDRGDEVLDENSPQGRGFLADLVHDWEREASRAEDLGMRVVRTRFGIVLSRRGGALKRMLLPFRLGLGGRLGSGRHWMSWVALEDVTGAIDWALTHPVSGAFNVTGPTPVTNADFTRALARQLRRPALFPVPPIALRLLFGRGPADELLLASQRGAPSRLLDAGYRFAHADVRSALAAALQR